LGVSEKAPWGNRARKHTRPGRCAVEAETGGAREEVSAREGLRKGGCGRQDRQAGGPSCPHAPNTSTQYRVVAAWVGRPRQGGGSLSARVARVLCAPHRWGLERARVVAVGGASWAGEYEYREGGGIWPLSGARLLKGPTPGRSAKSFRKEHNMRTNTACAKGATTQEDPRTQGASSETTEAFWGFGGLLRQCPLSMKWDCTTCSTSATGAAAMRAHQQKLP
jgi:hypothetical protein